MSDDGGAASMTREERLAGYKELREGLEEMLATPEDERDVEMRALITDAMAELRVFAESLNAEETVEVTPGLVKVMVPVAAAGSSGGGEAGQTTDDTHGGDGDDATGAMTTIVRFPPPSQPRLCAPYEVLYDETTWYACVVVSVVPAAQPIDRVRYRVCILGYNVEEEVYSESLRPWRPSATLTEQLGSGVRCYAIHPRTARFVPATVERLTLDGTVLVTLTAASEAGTSPAPTAASCTADGKMDAADTATAMVELPLSHVRVGRVYAQLRKRPQLSEAERAARRRANAQRKRERAEVERQQRADKIAQDSSDWRSLVGDLMGGGGATRQAHATKRSRYV